MLPEINNRAVVLHSGGLDSSIALKLMLELGVEATALNFTSPLFSGEDAGPGRLSPAEAAAARFGAPIVVRPMGPEFMEVVRRPRHGYGRELNPCVDCRIFLMRRAARIMEEVGASFLVTGEVLGQRPKSQKLHQLNVAERESGLAGRILRPLSARLLPETLPEQAGIVDRSRLLDISGRSRKAQMAWAEEHDIGEYPTPGGGCLLTDAHYARRLRDLLEKKAVVTDADLALLKFGRHFRLTPEARAILGKNAAENERLEAQAPPGSWTVARSEDRPGPTLLLVFDEAASPDEALLALAGRLVLRYSKKPEAAEEIVARRSGEERRFSISGDFDAEELAALAL